MPAMPRTFANKSNDVMSITTRPVMDAPLVCELPYRVLAHIADLLDVPAVHNWRSLIALLPEYTQKDVMALTIEEQSGRSASMEILHDLHTRGWTVVDLALLTRQAQLAIVTDTITQFYSDQGTPLSLPDGECTLPLGRYPQSAKTCYDCPSSPVAPSPPAKEALPGPLEVPYQMLAEATGNFDRTPHKQGGHKLGEGGFGEVFYGQLRITGGVREVAVKLLNEKEGGSTSVDKKQFHTELRALCQLSHECILPVLGFSCDGPHSCILYQFMPHGSLDFHIRDIQALPPVRRIGVASDVATALEYLHCGMEECVVHRDVKSANILLTKDWRGKLGDFGVVRFLPSADTTMTTSVVGTLIYMAPEYSKGMVSPAADIYAFGVVLYELITGLSAQEEVEAADTDLLTYIEEFDGQVLDVLIGQWREEVGKGVWQLAEKCVEHNRKKRPTATELLLRLRELLTMCQSGTA